MKSNGKKGKEYKVNLDAMHTVVAFKDILFDEDIWIELPQTTRSWIIDIRKACTSKNGRFSEDVMIRLLKKLGYVSAGEGLWKKPELLRMLRDTAVPIPGQKVKKLKQEVKKRSNSLDKMIANKSPRVAISLMKKRLTDLKAQLRLWEAREKKSWMKKAGEENENAIEKGEDNDKSR